MSNSAFPFALTSGLNISSVLMRAPAAQGAVGVDWFAVIN